MKKEILFKLWAYDAEVKAWSDRKEKLSKADLEMIDNIQKKSENVRAEILKYILSQDDPYIRSLLLYRCADRKSWKEVAQLLGGSAESHRKALSRFTDEMENGP